MVTIVCGKVKFYYQIPSNTDILMTHGPPVAVGDYTRGGVHAGCVDLLDQIQNRIKPLYHCFGHIHEGNLIFSLFKQLLILKFSRTEIVRKFLLSYYSRSGWYHDSLTQDLLFFVCSPSAFTWHKLPQFDMPFITMAAETIR